MTCGRPNRDQTHKSASRSEQEAVSHQRGCVNSSFE
ncbi:hypothetical protein BDFB_015040 [Asbolus verrucosus]|uniref:Uncharacterized protein n=1 Tax=Asbolus verrucosus TaxID=1661398 RepID=A0A482W4G3_ASBVE|nr:hypothetical protein BDFB_015040 [Asbolus verrucosus]